jgi:hypothetical protein
LLLAGFDTRHILLGKHFGRVAQVALLMIAGLPLFALLAGFAGVGPVTLLIAAVALIMPLFTDVRPRCVRRPGALGSSRVPHPSQAREVGECACCVGLIDRGRRCIVRTTSTAVTHDSFYKLNSMMSVESTCMAC